MSISFSQEDNKPYLYGVPPEPPYQEAEATLKELVTDGCMLSDEKLVGYIISIKKDNGNNYALVQDEDGVRHKCYIDTDLTSNTDKSRLKYILIPGRKVEVKYQVCGSGGYIYVMEVKNLKR
jgi:hypothetical protein